MTDKKNIQALAETCRVKGIKQIVFSPGSRSAPLVIAFSQMQGIECIVIPDERVAGFFALGIAQQTQNPVAVVCTSGTAVLNLAPAICEAYYQQVPLLILTADRPMEYIGIGENQAINQTGIFNNYIKASYTLTESVQSAIEIAAKAKDAAIFGYAGPVHINIPLREPLYGTTNTALTDFVVPAKLLRRQVSAPVIQLSAKNMLICGLNMPDEKLLKVVAELWQRGDMVVVAEPLSNIPVADVIINIDATLTLLNDEELLNNAPDTIITVGKQIVSKKLRQYLRKVQPTNHYHISTDRGEWNGLGAKQYHHIIAEPAEYLSLLTATKPATNTYKQLWQITLKRANQLTALYSKQAPYSDWSVFNYMAGSFPTGANIHFGNSSPVRYGCMFPYNKLLTINANRGTSGIDGCVSTAAGAAFGSGKPTICIVGDISFLYDSNALWNNALSPNLRIIVINNGGGNIFRLIEGPKSMPGFEKFFETKQNLTAELLAQMYQIPYYFCDRAEDLDFVSVQFYKPQKGGRPAILEIKTDGITNEKVYKQYFEFLKNS